MKCSIIVLLVQLIYLLKCREFSVVTRKLPIYSFRPLPPLVTAVHTDFMREEPVGVHDRCKADDKFPCADNRTIICASEKCDDKLDCPGGDDEINCGIPTACWPDEFRCKNGVCIPAVKRCDGVTDCYDSTDEDNCFIAPGPTPAPVTLPPSTPPAPLLPPVCTFEEFSCDGRCFPVSKKCDNVIDCSDQSDERDCGRGRGARECEANEFKCNNGECIKREWRCDDSIDCEDSSDEWNCPLTPKGLCSSDEFSCGDGQCIPSIRLCDAYPDCKNGIDERNCSKCNAGTFRCNDRRCIPFIRRCDGYNDCNDSSDEMGCSPAPIPDPEKPTIPPKNGNINEPSSKNETCRVFQFQWQESTARCVSSVGRCEDQNGCSSHLTNVKCTLGEQHNSTAQPTTEKNNPQQCEPNQFKCDDGKCIKREWRCDEILDCDDLSDELNCSIPLPASQSSNQTIEFSTNSTPPQSCMNDEFQCKNRICISDSFRCDGAYDCIDHSDEENCTRSPRCSPSDFVCDDGSCVSGSSRCNGNTECADASDEKNCPRPSCRSDEFQCDDRQCILTYRRCDGYPDCGDGSDELNCPRCRADEFTCSDGHCVSMIRHCDGNPDCRDFSDEIGCPAPTTATTTTTTSTPPPPPAPSKCDPNDFQCDNGICIKENWLCDGVDNCNDLSDERNCAPPPRKCNDDEFTCDDQYCIPSSGLCDNIPDCEDHSDEIGCPTEPAKPDLAPPECEPNEFKCDNGKCIKGEWRCDESNDCEDSSDERNCSIALPVRCNAGEYECGDHHCIPEFRRCDGTPDCRDYSDEVECPPRPTPGPTPPEDPTTPPKCKQGEFRCADGECIPKIYRCDSERDCGDESDEYNCSSQTLDWRCSYNEFKCASGRQCIPKSFHCDFDHDCHDGSDEWGCFKPSIFEPPPSFVNLNIGETFYITCSTIGNPTPEVIWRLNGGHVPASCTSTSANGVGTLTCINVQLSDQGTYSCEPHNVKGLSTYIPKTILKLKNLPRNG